MRLLSTTAHHVVADSGVKLTSTPKSPGTAVTGDFAGAGLATPNDAGADGTVGEVRLVGALIIVTVEERGAGISHADAATSVAIATPAVAPRSPRRRRRRCRAPAVVNGTCGIARSDSSQLEDSTEASRSSVTALSSLRTRVTTRPRCDLTARRELLHARGFVKLRSRGLDGPNHCYFYFSSATG